MACRRLLPVTLSALLFLSFVAGLALSQPGGAAAQEKPAADSPAPAGQPPAGGDGSKDAPESGAPDTAADNKDAEPAKRSPSQVEALIAEAGKTQPEWWDSVKLDYPASLDLSWQQSKEGWKPDKYIGQYIITVLNPNPGKWRGGIKLLHHTLTVNKSDPQKLTQSMQALGRAYFNYERDWARAAYWLRKAQAGPLELAECYWRLGCRQMAVAALAKFPRDPTRNGTAIKLWAEMGDIRRALALAEDKARAKMADVAYLTAGNACRLHGRYKDAAKYYERVLGVAKDQAFRDYDRNKERARRALEAARLLDALDLKRVADGTHKGSDTGYRGEVEVEVEVKGGRIEACKVTRHKEDMCFNAPTEIPAGIVRNQGPKGVDAITGATISSDAIINAAAKALAGGMKKQ